MCLWVSVKFSRDRLGATLARLIGHQLGPSRGPCGAMRTKRKNLFQQFWPPRTLLKASSASLESSWRLDEPTWTLLEAFWKSSWLSSAVLASLEPRLWPPWGHKRAIDESPCPSGKSRGVPGEFHGCPNRRSRFLWGEFKGGSLTRLMTPQGGRRIIMGSVLELGVVF